MSTHNREQWLYAIVEQFKPIFVSHGYPLPALRVTCGFPSGGGTRLRSPRVIGEIHPAANSADQHCEIFISPVNADSVTVAAVLAHELVHAAVGLDKGHNSEFGALARKIGLEGKLTATVASPAFEALIKQWVEIEGDYPHAALSVDSKTKQSIRMLKAHCPSCGYTVRATAKWLNASLPVCGTCGTKFVRG